MPTTKALHHAASRSLDGHIRFVVALKCGVHVFTLDDLLYCPRARICAVFEAGHLVGKY